MVLGADTKAVLVAAGVMFLAALAQGVWKYPQMASSADHLAHPYVDTAHRAALLYGFAHGWRRDTDNQIRDRAPSASAVHGFMAALIVGEIGAFSLLPGGFLDGQVL